MKEIESVYRIIHDETYNNQVLLDIEEVTNMINIRG